jgi:hypothetical protein
MGRGGQGSKHWSQAQLESSILPPSSWVRSAHRKLKQHKAGKHCALDTSSGLGLSHHRRWAISTLPVLSLLKPQGQEIVRAVELLRIQ